MVARLARLLTLPVFPGDDAKTRQAALLNATLLTLLSAAVLYVFLAPLHPGSLTLRALIAGPFILIMPALRWIAQRGHVTFASRAVVVALWIMLTFAAAISGGVTGPAYVGYLVVVLCAGLLLGRRASLLIAGVSALSGVILIEANAFGLLPPIAAPRSEWWFWVAYSGFFFVTAVLLNLATRSLDKALQQARRELAERRRAEEALASSEKRFRALIEHSDDGVSVLDVHGSVRYTGPAIGRILGYTPEEFMGRNTLELLHPDEREANQEMLQRLLQEPGHLLSAQVRFRHKDGSWRWLDGTGINLLHEPGIEGIVINFRDITAHKELEAKEQRRQVWLTRVVECGKVISRVTDLRTCLITIRDTIRIGLEFDRVGVFLYEQNNTVARGTFGVGLQGELTEEWDRVFPIESDEPLRRLVADPAGFIVDQDFEAAYPGTLHADMIGVKQHVTASAWAGDRPVGVIAADNVLTGRPFVEEQLEALRLLMGYVGLAIENARLYTEAQQRLSEQTLLFECGRELAQAEGATDVIRLAIEHMASYLHATSAYYLSYDETTDRMRMEYEYWTERANDAERQPSLGQTWVLSEYPHSALARKTGLPQMHTRSDADLSPAEQEVYEFWGGRTLVAVPTVIQGQFIGFFEIWDSTVEKRYDERTLQLLLTLATQAAIKLENLQLVTRLQRSLQRTTELAIAVEAANRLKGEILANTSHELRTPLTAIQGALGLVLSDTLEAREEERRWLQVAYASSEKLLTMINTLLDVARLEADRMVLQPSAVDMLWLLREVEGLARGQALAKGLHLRFELSEPAPVVWADRDRVRQIILSLLGNALKFTEQGGVTVSLHMQPELQQVDVIVRDTGTGIAPEVLERIFQPFVQADGSTTRRHGGAGLGLYIARRLAELMGGALSLTSAGVGQGTIATLRLPLMSAG